MTAYGAGLGGLAGKVRALGNPDLWLQGVMSACIEAAKARQTLSPARPWEPGEPLKLLFAGYSGTRNTGADVRVEEMLRQFFYLLGEEQLDASVLTIDETRSQNYFRRARQVHLPKVFPAFLAQEVRKYHGVVTCEGSMFKSKFADALSTMMVGSLGLALAEGKLAIGYGGEAGRMSPGLAAMLGRYARDAYVLTRNEASTDILSDFGVVAETGTDTAWTFAPSTPERAATLAEAAGLDPERPILTLCPINPFWWPVAPSVRKAVAHRALGLYSASHYASLYFHKHGPEVHEAQTRYIQALARAAEAFARRHDYQVMIVGMEALDRGACESLAAALTVPSTVFVSDEVDMYDLVALLRQSALLVSSRYHAIVTSMPGLVPSIGVTMDERIRHLLTERGHAHYCFNVDDASLEQQLGGALEAARAEGPAFKNALKTSVASHLERMGGMGQSLMSHLSERLVGFQPRPEVAGEASPWAYLPPLEPRLRDLVAEVRGRELADTLAEDTSQRGVAA